MNLHLYDIQDRTHQIEVKGPLPGHSYNVPLDGKSIVIGLDSGILFDCCLIHGWSIEASDLLYEQIIHGLHLVDFINCDRAPRHAGYLEVLFLIFVAIVAHHSSILVVERLLSIWFSGRRAKKPLNVRVFVHFGTRLKLGAPIVVYHKSIQEVFGDRIAPKGRGIRS